MASLEPLIQKAKQMGTERDYLDWLRLWPSCLSGTYGHWEDGIGYCDPCHVRRVHLGAGTAVKPEYMAIPMTNAEHQLTHQKGDNVFYPGEWYEKKAIEYLIKWINGVRPPEPEEERTHWKREYVIESAGHMLALWLMVKKYFTIKKDGAVKVTIQRAVRRRSNKQNNLQWSEGLYGHQLDFYKQNPMAYMRDALAALNLKMQAGKLTKDDVHEMNKWLHNEGKSTAALSTLDSSAYHDVIREHHRELDKVIFPEPLNQGEYDE